MKDLSGKVISFSCIAIVFTVVGLMLGSIHGKNKIDTIKEQEISDLQNEVKRLKVSPETRIRDIDFNKKVMEDEERLLKIFKSYSVTNIHRVFVQSRVTDIQYMLFIKGGEFIGMHRIQ